jgi:hypothetical protein
MEREGEGGEAHRVLRRVLGRGDEPRLCRI